MKLFTDLFKLAYAIGVLCLIWQLPTIFEKLPEIGEKIGEKIVAKLWRKKDTDITTNVPPVAPMVANFNSLYNQERASYEDFSYYLLKCLKKIAKRYKLVVSNSPDDIYCAHVTDRVDFQNSHYIYRYEVRRQEPEYGGGMKKSGKDLSAQDIMEVLRENLPNELADSGYTYSDNVYVLDLDDTCIRIEVVGVNRQFPTYDTYNLY